MLSGDELPIRTEADAASHIPQHRGTPGRQAGRPLTLENAAETLAEPRRSLRRLFDDTSRDSIQGKRHMSNWVEGAQAAAFKQVENGYFFRAPWFFGPSLRVNEVQKAAIAERMRQSGKVVFWAGFMALMFGAGLIVAIAVHLKPALNPDGSMPVFWFLAVLLAVVAPIVAAMQIYMMHRLRPLLAGLPPTRERIRWHDRFKVQAASTSLPWLVGIGLGCVAMGLMQAFDLTKAVQAAAPTDRMILAAGALLICTVGAVYCFALAVYRANRT
jgi:hypothetical protein